MEIVLINPPAPSAVKDTLGVSAPALGLGYLASVAREAGFGVEILDCNAQDIDHDTLVSYLKRKKPEIVGITATTPSVMDGYRVASAAKELGSTVLMGGVHPSSLPVDTLNECPAIDVVVIGEGELTFRELLDRYDAGAPLDDVRGIAYREGGGVRLTEPRGFVKDIDELPMPAYDLMPIASYRKKERFGVIMTSRGCPFGCTFCSSSVQFGRRWRGHSPERVLDELKILHDEHGVREVEVLDDTFTLNKKRAQEICALLSSEMDISWACSSRVDTIDKRTLASMRRAGVHTVFYGIESGSDESLKKIGKGITTAKAVAAVRATHTEGISPLGSFMIGFPFEHVEDIKKTLEFSRHVGVEYAQFSIATPYPGSSLWAQAVSDGMLLTRNWRRYTALEPVMRLVHVELAELKRWLYRAWAGFYLRPSYILSDIVRRRGMLLRTAIRKVLPMLVRRKTVM